MLRLAGKSFATMGALPILFVVSFLVFPATARAQEAGGDLVGGAGIFRPKNPESKRSGNPHPVRPRLTAAEIEERYEDALSDGNDARDARKFAAAETSYRAAVSVKPRDARAFYGLGNVYTDQQRWEDAEKSYRQAMDFGANDPEILIALSYVLVQPRTGAMNAKRFADAEYFAQRATQLAPTNAIAFDRLGVARTARGLFNADTEAAFRRALEIDPKLVIAQIHLARVLRHLNKYSEADTLYKSAIDQAKDAPMLVLIADAMQTEQRWADSDPVLRRALQMDPKNPGALFLMGRLLAVNKNYADAEPVLRSAVEVNPKNFTARNILGRVYLGLERYDDAYKTYEAAVPLASDADKRQLAGQFGFGGVGDGYVGKGRPRDAVRAYQRALQLDPNNSELQSKLSAARAQP